MPKTSLSFLSIPFLQIWHILCYIYLNEPFAMLVAKSFILIIFINKQRGDKRSVIWCLYDPGRIKNSWCYSYFALIQILNSTRSFLLSLGKAKNYRWYIIRSFRSLNALISKVVYKQVINEISENASSRKFENQNEFSQLQLLEGLMPYRHSSCP